MRTVSRFTAAAVTAALVAACGSAEPGGEPDAPGGAALPRTRTVLVNTGAAVEALTATVRPDGRLIYEGDIDLGHINDQPIAGATSVILNDSSKRWPNGVLRWSSGDFDPADPADAFVLAEIQAAIAHISQRTPVKFEAGGFGDHVWFTKLDPDDPQAGSSAVGRQGGRQKIPLQLTADRGVIEHELLHALGVWHEQSRSDRDDQLTYNSSCVPSDYRHNFNKLSGQLQPETYDFSSIMHYSSDAFCIRPPPPGDAGIQPCNCMPIVRKPTATAACPGCTDEDGDGFAEFINPNRRTLSVRDINGLFQLYGRPLAVMDDADDFGSAVAVGDFDADGFDDLAVGSPGEMQGPNPGGLRRSAGSVEIFKGTRTGLAPWRELDATTGSLGSFTENGYFGAALAVGDFNNDGADDLAIGAPGQEQLFVYLGAANVANRSTFGLRPDAVYTAASFGRTGASGDFGVALASGDFDKDGDDDLAIANPWAGTNRSGEVIIARASRTTGFSSWTVLGQHIIAQPLSGDRFGLALATADFDGDGDDDLAVGAPYKDQNQLADSGTVFLFEADAGSVTPWWTFSASSISGSVRANEHFGLALAAGKLDAGPADLAIGAPGLNGGTVHLFRGVSGDHPASWRKVTQSGLSASETNDQFGAALAIGKIDGDSRMELVVGAPGDRPKGRVFVFRGGDDDIGPWQSFAHAAGEQEWGFMLGTSMAIGDFEARSRGSVIAGDASYQVSQGLVLRQEYSSADGGKVVPAQVLTQATAGAYYDP